MLPYGNSRLICSRTASSLAALGRIVQIIEQAITVLLLYHERGFARALAIKRVVLRRNFVQLPVGSRVTSRNV
jgi:hypothetical protein